MTLISIRLLPQAGSRQAPWASPNSEATAASQPIARPSVSAEMNAASPSARRAARVAHARRRLGREAAREHTQPPEQRLLRRGKQVVAPGDGVAHRLLPRWQVSWSLHQQRQPPAQRVEHYLKAQL